MAFDPNFVEASQQSEPEEFAEDAIGIESIPSPDMDPTPPPPNPTMRTLRLPASNSAVLLTEIKPYRRQVTIVQFAAAITIEVSYDELFRYPDILRMTETNFVIPLFAGQRLWARQNTAADQTISVMIEPRGDMR